MEQQRDPHLWKIAKKRAGFRIHLFTYIIIIGFLWISWALGMYSQEEGENKLFPLYATLGWGIGLAFHYFSAYHGDKNSLAEREYRKLEEEQKRK